MVWNLVEKGLGIWFGVWLEIVWEFGCEWYENLVRNGLGIRLEMV